MHSKICSSNASPRSGRGSDRIRTIAPLHSGQTSQALARGCFGISKLPELTGAQSPFSSRLPPVQTGDRVLRVSVFVCVRKQTSKHVAKRRSDAHSSVNQKNQFHAGHDGSFFSFRRRIRNEIVPHA